MTNILKTETLISQVIIGQSVKGGVAARNLIFSAFISFSSVLSFNPVLCYLTW